MATMEEVVHVMSDEKWVLILLVFCLGFFAALSIFLGFLVVQLLDITRVI